MRSAFRGFKLTGIKSKNTLEVEKLFMLPTEKDTSSSILSFPSAFFSKLGAFN